MSTPINNNLSNALNKVRCNLGECPDGFLKGKCVLYSGSLITFPFKILPNTSLDTILNDLSNFLKSFDPNMGDIEEIKQQIIVINNQINTINNKLLDIYTKEEVDELLSDLQEQIDNISIINIYNSDGTLESNRVVNGDGNNLLLDNIPVFGVYNSNYTYELTPGGFRYDDLSDPNHYLIYNSGVFQSSYNTSYIQHTPFNINLSAVNAVLNLYNNGATLGTSNSYYGIYNDNVEIKGTTFAFINSSLVKGSFIFNSLTAARNYTFPNASGTVALQEWVSANFLTSFSETDPTVPSYVKSITLGDISNWNTAYSWGNHSGLYPLLTGSYNNPSWINTLAWSKITGAPAFITTETDPTVPAHVKAITTTDIINWNAVPNLQQVTTAGAITNVVSQFNGVVIGYVTGSYKGFFSASPFAFLTGSNAAARVYTGGILSSDNFSDSTLIPGNGIYSKGNIISGGTITSNGFIKTGGLSTQFLKADGSVDSNTYLPSTASSTLNPSDNFNSYLSGEGTNNMRSSGYWYQLPAGTGYSDKHPLMRAGAMISSTGLFGEYRQLYFDNLGGLFGRGSERWQTSYDWVKYWSTDDFVQLDVNKLKSLWQPTIRGRYIKITSVNNSAIPGTSPTLWFELSELEVYAGYTNVALGKTVTGTAVSINSNAQGAIVNGQRAAFDYFAATGDDYLIIDLGAEYDITNIILYPGAFGNFGWADIHYSLDNLTYNKYASFTVNSLNANDITWLQVLSERWNTAYSWGNHATAGYLTSVPIATASTVGAVKPGTGLSVDGSGALSISSVFDSGSYTPTTNNYTNIANLSFVGAYYMRVNDIVSLEASFRVTQTSLSQANFNMSIPIASNFTASSDAIGGVSGASLINTNTLGANASTDNIRITCEANTTSEYIISISLKYIIKP